MDLRQIRNLMKEFEESNIHKLELTEDNFSIILEKAEVQTIVAAAPQAVVSAPVASAPVAVETNEVVASNYTEVVAPLVGTFYSSPSPDSDPFVKVGQKVNKGDVLFIVEAMKVMNEITAPCSGEVMSINVDNGNAVEFNEVVMEIKE